MSSFRRMSGGWWRNSATSWTPGLWAAVPLAHADGHREAVMVRSFAEIPRDAERVIFFPRAAGG